MKHIILLLLILAMGCQSKNTNTLVAEPPVTNTDKMSWWRNARFGMFIHWGLYSIPAGEWKGEKISGISEWIMYNAKIPVKDYESLTKQFNPVKFNADEWVRLAKEAGMKYIVITSKHHDGFAMFKSNASSYNIADATPFGKDPLKDLAAACKKYDIKLGFYHSQAQDWNHPGGSYWGMEDGKEYWDKSIQRKTLDQYIDEKVVPQVREILTNYGNIAVIWWDTPVAMTESAAKKLHSMLSLQPGIIENNRLYSPWKGDFSTPEQTIPPTGLDYDWEVCMTMNTSWGYKYYDNEWKSTKTLIQYLTDIVSKGGNFLLNVGPTSLGQFPDSSILRLKEIGKWMDKNSESIYGTSASPFFKLVWGRCTKKEYKDSTRLYLHVFNWPNDQKLIVPGLRSQVKRVYLLENGIPLDFKNENNQVVVSLPAKAPNMYNSVVVVDIKDKLIVDNNIPSQDNKGIVYLPAIMSFIHNEGNGKQAELSEMSEKAFITGWLSPQTMVEWIFDLSRPGNYEVNGEIATSSKEFGLTISNDNNNQLIRSRGTGGIQNFRKVKLGEVRFNKTGRNMIRLRLEGENRKGINLKSISLEIK